MLGTSYTTTLTVQQAGATLIGAIVIEGVLDATLVGALNESTQIVEWTAFDDCVEWTGTLTVNGDSTEMSGPVSSDVTACASGSPASGTVSLFKQ